MSYRYQTNVQIDNAYHRYSLILEKFIAGASKKSLIIEMNAVEIKKLDMVINNGSGDFYVQTILIVRKYIDPKFADPEELRGLFERTLPYLAKEEGYEMVSNVNGILVFVSPLDGNYRIIVKTIVLYAKDNYLSIVKLNKSEDEYGLKPLNGTSYFQAKIDKLIKLGLTVQLRKMILMRINKKYRNSNSFDFDLFRELVCSVIFLYEKYFFFSKIRNRKTFC